MHRLLLLILLAPLLASAAAAQPAKAPAGAAAAPRVAESSIKAQGLDYLVGSWRADAVDPSTGDKFTFDYRVEQAPGGSWIAGFGRSVDGAIQSRDMWGADPLTGGIVRVIFNGNGALATVRSPGWKGNTLVLEGDSSRNGRTLPLRETITRVGPNEFRAVWEAFREGAWSPYSVERLTRLAA
jgi:hypothetical protein